MSEAFALQRVREAQPDDRDGQIDLAYGLAMGCSPDAREKTVAAGYLDAHNLDRLAYVLLNTNKFVYLELIGWRNSVHDGNSCLKHAAASVV